MLDPEHRVTPIDTGDVCLNYDKAGLQEAGLKPPRTLADLTDPAYAGTLVVENPATSSPGLAFLLATVDEFGEDGWQDYWRDLVANDIEVAARLGGGLLRQLLRARPAARATGPWWSATHRARRPR